MTSPKRVRRMATRSALALVVVVGVVAPVQWLRAASSDDAAVATAVAVRTGQRTQIDPIEPPPVEVGCLIGIVETVSTGIDSRQRWKIGSIPTSNGWWKVAYASASGARGPIAVVGDSLTLGVLNQTMRGLVDAGYGPVCVDAGIGRRIPASTTSAVSSGVQVIARLRAGEAVWKRTDVRWVMALGTNDTRSYTTRYAGFIKLAMDTIGTTTRPVYWVNVRTLVPTYADVSEPYWNSLLPRTGVVVIDWWTATKITPEIYFDNDLIHASPLGSALRVQITMAALT